jgi:Tfp pilus assembly protein PilP
MKLAKKFANLATLAFALSLGSTVGAQSQPAQKPAPKAKAAKSSKAAKPATAKPAASDAAPAAAPESAPAPDKSEPIVAKRDPFVALVTEPKEGGSAEHLPPGKAGLVISSVRVDGAVKAPNGMIAVLENPEQRVYFVHEGDHLYDGDVEKIGLDGVTFKENSKDAFGKAVERLITKRIYPSAGEQQ